MPVENGLPHDSSALPAHTPPTRPRRRWLGALVAFIAMAVLLGAAWYLTHRPASKPPGAMQSGGPGGGGGGGGGRGGPPTTVGVASAQRADVPVYLDALGTVTPAATVTVRPQVSGVLTKVEFREGETVRKGQLLATIDPRSFEMAVMQSQGQLQRDQAQLEAARVTLKRYETLLQQDSIARQDVDTQAALVKQLEAALVGDRAALGTARLNLTYTRIVAPVAGRLGLRVVDAGNVVSTGDVDGIAVITQLAPIDVVFSVPQDRVPEIEQRSRDGNRLSVTALDRARTATLDTGTFGTLDNRIDATTGTVRAKARFQNAGNTLFPNQFVNVRMLVSTVSGAIVVPAAALRQGATGDFVYVLNDNRTVSVRQVTRGLSAGDRTAIVNGLDAGERVITEGGDRLRDGSRVQLPGQAASGASGAASGGRGMRGQRGASGPGFAGSGASGAFGASGRRPAASE